MRCLAERYQVLSAEVATLDTELDRLTAKAAPGLVALFGVGPDSAGALLVAAGDNPGRLRSDAAFSMLCGASPIEASSGKTIRHRRNRGGDRQANAALYRIVVVRLRWHQPTRDYLARRLTEGKSKQEIIRCLKRYVAREVFAVLTRRARTPPPRPLDSYTSVLEVPGGKCHTVMPGRCRRQAGPAPPSRPGRGSCWSRPRPQ